MSHYPEDRVYYTEHEWVKKEDDQTATVGISWYAQDSLGDIVYVSVSEPGTGVKAGETVGEIESVKAVSEIYSPVSGTIIEVNQECIDSPEILNSDPYEKGWIFRIQLSNPAELNDLMDAQTYAQYVEGEQD